MSAKKMEAAPLPKPTDIVQEKPRLTEYVCASCFRRPDDCVCGDSLPESLLVIDEGIQEHVRILNEKGYETSYCCESHNPLGNLYIMFRSARGLEAAPPPPSGFKSKCRGVVIEHMYGKDSRARRKMTHEEFEREKEACLASLLEWCKSLPVLDNGGTWRIRRKPSIRCAVRRGQTLEETLASYTCPYCDRSVVDCEGDHVKADRAHLGDLGIKGHLDLLKERGYSAESGCVGHGQGTSVFVKIWPSYIQAELGSAPEGFEMRRDLEEVVAFHVIPENLDDEAAEADRLAALERLLAWCEGLPEARLRY